MRATATMLCALCVTAAAPSQAFAQTPSGADLTAENERLRDALRPFLGTLDIDCSPAGASVYVNDQLQGSCATAAIRCGAHAAGLNATVRF